MAKNLTSLVEKGKELVLKGANVRQETYEFLGRLTQLENDRQVKSVSMEGETIHLPANENPYFHVYVKLSRTLSEKQIKNLLERNTFSFQSDFRECTSNHDHVSYMNDKNDIQVWFGPWKLT